MKYIIGIFLAFFIYATQAKASGGLCEIKILLINKTNSKKNENRLIQREKNNELECRNLMNEFRPKLKKNEVFNISYNWIPKKAGP